MKKKRKIVISLIVAFGLFINISGNVDTKASQTVDSTPSFTTFADEPIGGSHWKVFKCREKLRVTILYLETGLEDFKGIVSSLHK